MTTRTRTARTRTRKGHWTDPLPDGLKYATRDQLRDLAALERPKPTDTPETTTRLRDLAEIAKEKLTSLQGQARATLKNGKEYGVSAFAWRGLLFLDPDFRAGSAVLTWWDHQGERYRAWKKEYNREAYKHAKAGVLKQWQSRNAFVKALAAVTEAIALPEFFAQEDVGRLTDAMAQSLNGYNLAGHYCTTCIAPLPYQHRDPCPTCRGPTDPWEVETYIRRAYSNAAEFRREGSYNPKLKLLKTEPVGEEEPDPDPFAQEPDEIPTVYPDPAAPTDEGEMEMHMDSASARRAREEATERRRKNPGPPDGVAAMAMAWKATLFRYFEACEAADAAGELPPPPPMRPEGFTERMPSGRYREWQAGRWVDALTRVPVSSVSYDNHESHDDEDDDQEDGRLRGRAAFVQGGLFRSR